MFGQIGKAYKSARNVCEKAIMDKKGTQLTPEQIAEIREVFDYFDEDKDGLLSLKEFQDGCQGMGMVMDEGTSEGHYGKLNGGKVRILLFFLLLSKDNCFFLFFFSCF